MKFITRFFRKYSNHIGLSVAFLTALLVFNRPIKLIYDINFDENYYKGFEILMFNFFFCFN
jgi:hypothetical protein